MRRNLIFLILLFSAYAAVAQGPEMVIPKPAAVLLTEGNYTYSETPEVKVIYVKDRLAPEAYELSVTRRGVRIRVSSPSGEFYARQTLDQMTCGGRHKQIPCCEISDAPRFPYRGLHVDVSRHFRSVDFLKKQIDAMAMFKMNRMHLHLTDAAGWRLQIDAYPRLTSFAAWRPQPTWKEWWAGKRLYADEGEEADAMGRLKIRTTKQHVMLVAIYPAAEMWAYRHYEAGENLPTTTMKFHFRPWKTDGYVDSDWTFNRKVQPTPPAEDGGSVNSDNN